MDCLFCKITNKEIPNYTVYEDEYVLAFLDIHPCAKGHTVVIPKKHFDNLAAMPELDFINVSRGLRRAISRVQEIIAPDGLNIGINNGQAAGQAVNHTHWHIIPRWHDDGGGSIHSIVKNETGIDVKEIALLFSK